MAKKKTISGKKDKKEMKVPLIVAIIVIVVLIVLAIIFGGKIPLREGFDIPDEVYGFSGEIKDVKGNVLFVEALILLKDSEKEPLKQNLEVLVNENTKILKLEFPNPEQIPQGSSESVSPEQTEINFEQLKVGDKIDISTEENISENIKNKTQFTANVINVVE